MSIDLPVSGMTCATCARRIEKKLNKLDGIEASVNYATERATVTLSDGATLDQVVAVITDLGYDTALPRTDRAPERDDDADDDLELSAMRHRVLVTAALTIPVVAMAMIPPLQFRNWQWLSLTLAAPAVVWGGWPFHVACYKGLRARATSMDTLVSLGTSAALAWSLYALFFGAAGEPGLRHDFSFLGFGADGHDHVSDGTANIYLEAAAGVTLFLLAGRYIEHRSRRAATGAIRALLELGAKDVAVVRGKGTVRIPIDQLAVGDTFRVRPGEKIATDGEITDGASAVDTSLVTGEPVPRDVSIGDAVTGGTINTSGALTVRATRVGADTQLAAMTRLVEQAQSGRADVQRLADKVSAVFVPIVLLLALATCVFWFATGAGAVEAFTATVAVLIIACPCALGLATPMALLVGTGQGARFGIVIKGPQVLETSRGINTVVLDKTGTVTTGAMAVSDVVSAVSTSGDVLRMAAGVEHHSEHPIGRAIVRGAGERGVQVSPATDFASHAGRGITGRVEIDGAATEVVVGRLGFVIERTGGEIPDATTQRAEQLEKAGATVIAVGSRGAVDGLVAVSDTIKPSSRAAVEGLRKLGCHTVLLTGDSAGAAGHVAQQVGVDEVIAGVLPHEKVDHVARLQAAGRVVAMVGDGVNDAPALATADLGIAMGSGTDVAIEAADITVVRDDVTSVVDALRLSRATLRTIRSNLFWAFAYNAAAIPLAMAGMLNPMIAGFAMAFSSVFVVLNSLTLRRFRGASERD